MSITVTGTRSMTGSSWIINNLLKMATYGTLVFSLTGATLEASQNSVTASDSLPTMNSVTPGSGWTDPIDQPDDEAGSIAANKTFVCAFTGVSRDIFTDDFIIWLQGRHPSGTNSIMVSVNNGTPVEANLLYNSNSGTLQYGVRVNRVDFPDAYYEVRAIATPNTGVCHVLQGDTDHPWESFFFTMNGLGSIPRVVRYVNNTTGDDGNDGLTISTPMATIMVALVSACTENGGTSDGVIIKLHAGTYQIPSRENTTPDIMRNSEAYLEFMPDEGSIRANVIINGTAANLGENTDGLITNYQKYTNVTLTGIVKGSAVIKNSNPDHDEINAVWFHDCEADGPGEGAGPDAFFDNQATRRYITGTTYGDSYWHNMQDLPTCNVFTNTRTEYISQEGYHEPQVLVHCTINHHAEDGSVPGGLHPDALQWTESPGLAVIDNLVMGDDMNTFAIRAQYSGGQTTVSDIVILNSTFSRNNTVGALWQMERLYTMWYIENCDFSGSTLQQTGSIAYDDFYFASCSFHDGCTAPDPTTGLHFV